MRGVYDKEKEKEGKSDVVKIEKLKLLEVRRSFRSLIPF